LGRLSGDLDLDIDLDPSSLLDLPLLSRPFLMGTFFLDLCGDFDVDVEDSAGFLLGETDRELEYLLLSILLAALSVFLDSTGE
jgi:hypothetical protein